MDLTPIQTFYDDAHVLITGATGFLGHVLIDRLIQSCPTLNTIYMLIRTKKDKSMDQRLDAMFDDVVFDNMKMKVPNFREKIIGVPGDCTLPALGLDLEHQQLLIEKVNIVFHLAATVNMDSPLKKGVHTNIRASKDLLILAKQMKHLKSFVHCSTFYANCCKTNELIEEKIYEPPMDGDQLETLVDTIPESLLVEITPKLLGDFVNVYTFTKQIAESIVKKYSTDLPVGIFRPAIVVSTYKSPIPGWINNYYGPSGIFLASGMGILRIMYANPDTHANLVPADMVVNSMIIAAKEIADNHQLIGKEFPVYNYGSINDQLITWRDFHYLSHKHGQRYPSVKAIWKHSFYQCRYYKLYKILWFFMHYIPGVLVDTALKLVNKKPMLSQVYKKVYKLSNVLAAFAIQQWAMKNDNVRRQQLTMTDKDRNIFFCDLKKLNWDDFFKTFGLGLRVYVAKDPISTLEAGKAKDRKLYILHQFVLVLLIGLFLLILKGIYSLVSMISTNKGS